MDTRTTRALALAAAATVLFAAPAAADVAVGVGFVLFETSMSLLLAPATLVIETIIAIRIFRLPWVTCAVVALMSNLASALIGFTAASFLYTGRIRPLGDFRHTDAQTVALMMLCIPLFVVSVLVEAPVAKRFLPADRHSLAWRWSIEANLASYSIIEAVLFVVLNLERFAGLMN